MDNLIPAERVESKIYLIRGQKVMLDRDLAELYRVSTKRLNEQVKRNIDRFPNDFMFQLTITEKDQVVANCDHPHDDKEFNSRSQIATLKQGHNIKYLPCAFTEQGVAMLSSVLKSKRAIQMNILIMRAFVKINRVLATHKEVSRKLIELEQRVGKHDFQIIAILDAIRKMIEPDPKPAKRMGFMPNT